MSRLILDALENLFAIGWLTLDWWLIGVAGLLSAFASGHALLQKRYPQAALGWIAVVWLMPLYGPILYGILGVNRVRARAQAMDYGWRPPPAYKATPSVPASRQRLASVARTITGTALCGGNRVVPLHGGEAAYEQMLGAIEGAQDRIWLASYIFDADEAGYQFIDALYRATQREVDVRVLVDGIGALYSRPKITKALRKRGIPFALFIPPRLFPPSFHINLRNHRKLLVVDTATSFTGGMNIGNRHLLEKPGNRAATQDIHFRIEGPVTAQLAHLFAHDWRFASGEALPNVSLPACEEVAPTWCRTVVDGPDENLDRLRALILAALSNARETVRIMSPYFLPGQDLIAAMTNAALAGVQVEVILPEKNNLPPVAWAMHAIIPRMFSRGVRFWMQPEPFAHSKLLLVDDDYALVGTANIDARSLRLNFEVGLEIYDRKVAGALNEHFEDVLGLSSAVTNEYLQSRKLPTRLRDAAAWLLSPYL